MRADGTTTTGGWARSMATWCLELLGALVVVTPLALSMGWLSRAAYVIGLGPIVTGLAAGAGAGLVALLVRGGSRGAMGSALVAIVAGWVVIAAMDDLHFRAEFKQTLAFERLAESAAGPGTQLDDDMIAFVASDADQQLSAQVSKAVGFDGPVARWLFRAEAGIRLLGPWDSGRGLPVGRPGAIIWACLELLLAAFVASRVLRHVFRRAESGQDLSHQADENDDPA